MTRWLAFNLSDGQVAGRWLVAPTALEEIHSPCAPTGTDPGSPSPNAAYALGWFINTYNGQARISHGAYGLKTGADYRGKTIGVRKK